MDKPTVTADRLRELIDYDPGTGAITRRGGQRGARPGRQVTATNESGYLVVNIDGRVYRGHRLAWLWMTGGWPPAQIDHRNGDPGDNRWSNLRAATPTQNAQNRQGAQTNNKLGLLGVTLHRQSGLYHASIVLNGHKISLRYHETPEEAHAVYMEARREVYPYNTL
jgi:hypothetical protein